MRCEWVWCLEKGIWESFIGIFCFDGSVVFVVVIVFFIIVVVVIWYLVEVWEFRIRIVLVVFYCVIIIYIIKKLCCF